MVEYKLRWFEHVERRHVDSIVKRVYQMIDSKIIRGRQRSMITIRKTIMKYL